jgi:general secretion pathway protein A
MYLSHYNLRLKPFQITTDPRFIWLGEKHDEALATLIYGIQEDKGFLVLTGEIGTGKTSLINCLLKKLDYKVIKATISDPDMSINDFFKILSDEFNMDTNFVGKGDFLIQFKKFLMEAYSDEKKVLLVIDEAQRLNHDLLEQIRLLSNIEIDNAKLINIFFVGQNEFNDILKDKKSKAVLQRIAVRCNIDPLTATETKEFIKHRLKIAGTNEEIFTSAAIDEIYLFSNGYPRLINILCDHAMLTSYVKGKRIIDEKTITECAEELRLPSAESDNGNTDRLVEGKQEGRTFTPFRSRPSWIQPLLAASIVGLLLSTGLTFFIFKSEATKISPQKTTLSKTVDKTEHPTITPIDIGPLGKVETNTQLDSKLDEKQLHDLKTEHAKLKMSGENSIISEDNVQKHQLSTGNHEATDKIEHSTISQIDVGLLEKVETNKHFDNRLDEKQRYGLKMDHAKSNISDEDFRIPKDNATKNQPFSENNFVMQFALDSSNLPNKAIEKLDQLAELLINSPETKIKIKGYTDSTGDYDYNLSVSRLRADKIKSYLLNNGVNPLNIETFGLGPENPIASNATLEGRRKNRRVEIEFDDQFKNHLYRKSAEM